MLRKVLLYQQPFSNIYFMNSENAARAHFESEQISGTRVVQDTSKQTST